MREQAWFAAFAFGVALVVANAVLLVAGVRTGYQVGLLLVGVLVLVVTLGGKRDGAQ